MKNITKRARQKDLMTERAYVDMYNKYKYQ